MENQNTESNEWYNTAPYKLLGHSVMRELELGEVVPFGDGQIRWWNPIVNKWGHGYSNEANFDRVPNKYKEAGGFVADEDAFKRGTPYVLDEILTDEFLRDNNVRKSRHGRIYRPAKPNETGTLLHTYNSDVNAFLGEWTYQQIQRPMHVLWVVAEDQDEDAADDELDAEDIRAMVREVAITMPESEDEALDIARKEVKARKLAKAAVRKVLEEGV
jgi:hypothetical protein